MATFAHLLLPAISGTPNIGFLPMSGNSCYRFPGEAPTDSTSFQKVEADLDFFLFSALLEKALEESYWICRAYRSQTFDHPPLRLV